jgi:hypothetical protein
MTDRPPGLFMFERASSSAEAFVRFWRGCYSYPDEQLYAQNINGPITPATIRSLFKWKIGPRFFESHWPKIERTFVIRLDEALALPENVSAEHLLELFDEGGVVYRIFWLHCLRPHRFPIYDQHVHRAMNLIEGHSHRELSAHPQTTRVELYLKRYIPFHERHFDGHDSRHVDQALWAFGKFMNEKRNTSFARHASST